MWPSFEAVAIATAPWDDGRACSPQHLRSIDKLIINSDPAIGGQQADDQSGRGNRAAAFRHHAPVEPDQVTELLDAAVGFEPVIAFGDIGLVRGGDAGLQIGVAVHLALPHIMGAILDPEGCDLGTAGGRIGFIPDLDVTLGEVFGVGHGTYLFSNFSCRLAGDEERIGIDNWTMNGYLA